MGDGDVHSSNIYRPRHTLFVASLREEGQEVEVEFEIEVEVKEAYSVTSLRLEGQ